tara:strand:+ start:28075 stop:28449 length:375 start_codon:yes stop_codon:yes gene_type:complete
MNINNIDDLGNQIIKNGLNMINNIITNDDLVKVYKKETETELKLLILLAGVDKSNLTLNIEGSSLIIKAQSSVCVDEFSQFSEINYNKTIKTDIGLTKNNITAKMDNGVLKLTIKKNSESVNID